MILDSFRKALAQFDDPRFQRVLLLGVALTVLVLIAATAGVVWTVQQLTGDTITLPWLGEIRWLSDILSWGSVFLMLGLSVFLMIPVASAVTSLFLENVADAVEARYYPELPPVAHVGFFSGLVDTVNFLGVMIAANLLALVVYLLLLFTLPPAAPLAFWAVNGFLLGREYFTLAAMRRVGRHRARELGRIYRGTVWLAGTLMAVLLTIPLMNLLVPILGAATFTHIFHALTGAEARVRTSPDGPA